MSTHHIDTLRALPGALAALHGLATAHACAASIIGRVPGLDKLRAFPGVALPLAPIQGAACEADGGGGGGGDADDGEARVVSTDADYLHWGAALQDRALGMKPSEWHRLLTLAALFPDDEGYQVASLVVGLVRADLPTAVLVRCRTLDISPIDAYTAMAQERREAEDEGRAIVTPLSPDHLDATAAR